MYIAFFFNLEQSASLSAVTIGKGGKTISQDFSQKMSEKSRSTFEWKPWMDYGHSSSEHTGLQLEQVTIQSGLPLM